VTAKRELLAPATGGAVVILAMVVVAALGLRYHGAPVAGRFDTMVDEWTVGAVGRARPVASAVSVLGTVQVVGALALTAAVVLAWRYRALGAAALVLLAPSATTVAAEWLLKPWVGRTLEGDLSFPSGHTSRVTAFVVALVFAVHSVGASRRVLGIVGGVGLAAIAVLAWSMVAAGYHYATDTLAGVLVGGAIALVGGTLGSIAVRPVTPGRSVITGRSHRDTG
jgi:membrane-associated phospholipid phosphatase